MCVCLCACLCVYACVYVMNECMLCVFFLFARISTMNYHENKFDVDDKFRPIHKRMVQKNRYKVRKKERKEREKRERERQKDQNEG